LHGHQPEAHDCLDEHPKGTIVITLLQLATRDCSLLNGLVSGTVANLGGGSSQQACLFCPQKLRSISGTSGQSREGELKENPIRTEEKKSMKILVNRSMESKARSRNLCNGEK
jgi:hypothetical protein